MTESRPGTIQAQALAEQQRPTSVADQVDEILTHVYRDGRDGISLATHLSVDRVQMIREYIVVLQRQAAKSNNRKKTLRNLHKHHRATQLELRWVREAIRDGQGVPAVGKVNWDMLMGRARGTLWNQFKKELAIAPTQAQLQIDQLAAFILKEVPGEPSRSEGAVDTIIRWVKNTLQGEMDTLFEFGTAEEIRKAFAAAKETAGAFESFLNNNNLTMDQFYRFRDHNPLGLRDTPMSTAQADATDQHGLDPIPPRTPGLDPTPSPQQNVLAFTEGAIQLVEQMGNEIGETKENIDLLIGLVKDRDVLIEFLKTTAGWDFIDQSVETPITAVIRMVKEQQAKIEHPLTFGPDQRFKVMKSDRSLAFEGNWNDLVDITWKEGGTVLESLVLLAKFVKAAGYGHVEVDPIQEVKKLVEFFIENQLSLNESDPRNAFGDETPVDTAIRIMRENWAG